MRKDTKRRVCFAWLLLATFMPFFVVKALHYHEKGETASLSCSDSHHSRHSSDSSDSQEDCAICQFSLSLFTEAGSLDFVFTAPLISYEPVAYVEKTAYTLSYSHHLRAPPTA
ncbi:DUF2946 family protein [Bacteroides sp.]